MNWVEPLRLDTDMVNRSLATLLLLTHPPFVNINDFCPPISSCIHPHTRSLFALVDAMADPKTPDAPSPSTTLDDISVTEGTDSVLPIIDGEKDQRLSGPEKYPRPEQSLDDVVYHYLTFETDLLFPSDSFPSPNGTTLDPPNLQAFVSPFLWSTFRKNLVTWISCLVTACTSFTAGSYSSAVVPMSAEWDASQIAVLAGITAFTSGFAIAPMVLAPFSEINGRYPVFVVTGLLFVIAQAACAVAGSLPSMLVARFFVGVGGSTFSTMVGGVVSDIYHREDRNTPMALFAGAALFGTGLGPLVSGFIVQRVQWRWVFYLQVITNGLCILAVIIFFKETRGSVLLSRKAKTLNKYYETLEPSGPSHSPSCDSDFKAGLQKFRWKVKADEERESLTKMIAISLYRPFRP